MQSSTRGIVRPAQVGSAYRLNRLPCHPELADYVDRYWTVRWDLAGPRREFSSVLTHPAVHVSVEEGDAATRHGHPLPSALVHGVVTRRFEIELAGRGRVFGVKFRPGGFTALTGLPADRFTDGVADLADTVPDGGGLRERVLSESDDAGRAAIADTILRSLLPAVPDPRYARLRAVVEDVAGDRTVVDVAALARRHGMVDRTLQRMLRRYTGITASWLIRRYRLLDALDALQAEPRRDVSELAVTLGWYDQAHFTRDFTAAVGLPPARYARVTRLS